MSNTPGCRGAAQAVRTNDDERLVRTAHPTAAWPATFNCLLRALSFDQRGFSAMMRYRTWRTALERAERRQPQEQQPEQREPQPQQAGA